MLLLMRSACSLLAEVTGLSDVRVGSAASSASWKSLSSSSMEMLVWCLGFTSMLAFAHASERNAMMRPLPLLVSILLSASPKLSSYMRATMIGERERVRSTRTPLLLAPAVRRVACSRLCRETGRASAPRSSPRTHPPSCGALRPRAWSAFCAVSSQSSRP